MNNLLSYCGLVDVIINASDKDLPVLMIAQDSHPLHIFRPSNPPQKMIFGIIEPWPAAQWTVWGNFQTFSICMLPTFGKKFVTMTGINITFGEKKKVRLGMILI